MKQSLRLFLFLLPLSLLARAMEMADLGPDLSYLRVHALADAGPSLSAALPAPHALVLDLRYTTASEKSLAGLRDALALHPAGSPLFVLISPATPAPVVDILNRTPDALVTLGGTGTPSAKIVVKSDAATDRLAYDALDKGTPVATLISGKVEKDRFDEAALVQEFKNGNPDPAPPAAPDPTADKSDSAPVKPAPLIDHVLQRAVQLEQALQALHR